MPAPKKNSFYLLRSKNGRDQKYSDPKMLLEACYQYFTEVDNNPWIKKEPIRGGDSVGKLIDVPTARPYTKKGMCIFIGITLQTWENYRKQEGFLDIITHVEDIIYTQKFEGAAVGAFNHNIIARDLGLKENSNVNLAGSVNLIIKPQEGNDPIID
jgi:hypothetical protein